MRVLHVITRLIGGGAQYNTLRTALLHLRAGVEVELLYGTTDPSREGALVEQAEQSRLRLRHLPSLVREPSARLDPLALLALVRLFRQEPYDIVHTHTSKAGFLGRLAARLAGGARLVHTPHGHVFHSYYGPLTTRLYVLLERCASSWTDRLVALTPRERDEHLDYGIGTERQFEIVPSGIPLERWRAARSGRDRARLALGLGPADVLIGSVGRLAPVKGHAVLVRAFALLSGRVPRARLLLIGDGEERERLQELARGLGVADRVRFMGRLDQPEDVVAGLDLFALPSLNEGMGRVVLEAMAAGVPVVASAVGGVRDLVAHGSTGLLVPAGDPAALADALASLALSPALALELRAAASARVGPEYGEQAMADRLLAIYRDVLKRLG